MFNYWNNKQTITARIVWKLWLKSGIYSWKHEKVTVELRLKRCLGVICKRNVTSQLPGWRASQMQMRLCIYLNNPPSIHMSVLLPLRRPPHYEGTTLPSSHHKHHRRYSLTLNAAANYIDFRAAMLFALAQENRLSTLPGWKGELSSLQDV